MHIVVTAGHADHGKSALIRALTGAEPARRPVQRRRGASAATSTGDAGAGWVTLPSGRQLSLLDLPGDERFMTSMLAGAAAAAAAVLFVVAADAGWVPQAAEYLAMVSALGIRRGLLAVTKSDLADPAPVLAQVSAQIAQTSLGTVPAVALSSVTGAGIPELLSALDELGRSLPEPDSGAPVRIWIDRAVSGAAKDSTAAADSVIPESVSRVTGMLPAGTVHRGDELLVTPAMRPVRVQDLHLLGTAVPQTAGTARPVLTLTGRETLRRGMALVQPGRWTLTDVIDVRIRPAGDDGPGGNGLARPDSAWLHAARRAGSPATGQPVRAVTVYVGTARVTARVRMLGPGLARLTLADPLPLHVGDQLLLAGHPRRTAGRAPGAGTSARHAASWYAGAVVLDPAPPPLTRRGAGAAAAKQLAAWPDQPTAGELLARHGLMRASTMLAMGVSRLPSPVTGEWLADPRHWRALGHRLGEVLASHAASDPAAGGMPVDAARAALELPDSRLVTALARPPFQLSCGLVVIVSPADEQHGDRLPDAVEAAVRVLRADFEAAPFQSPDADRLRNLGLDARAVAAAVRAGLLLQISDHVVLAPGADQAAAAVLAELPEPFTAAQARQALATTRRTVIPLLEYLDAAEVTERLPDDRRVLRKPDR